jgi:Raf kinase inhibitor-like YbhB/YbcL family protein
MKKTIIFLIFPVIFIVSCRNKVEKPVTEDGKPENKQEINRDQTPQRTDTLSKTMVFKIKSSAFDAEGTIPKKYACNGDNISPPLSWSGAPSGTKSYTIIVDDPDAPNKTHTHWVIYNISTDVKELPENVPADKKLSNGALQGTNDNAKTGYSGPCPPDGTHRYFFKIYALDKTLDLNGEVTKEKLLDAMKGHVLVESELMGRYSK